MKTNILILLIMLYGCGAGDGAGELVEIRVNSHTVECIGEMQGNCLLVQEGEAIGGEDWELLYYENGIRGFDYEPGFLYDLVVRKEAVEDPPMDAASVAYELVKIRSKQRE